jgi:Family of unknown function (DUF6338)
VRKAVDCRPPGLVSTSVFVGTLLLVAFVWVWVGRWSLSASAFPDTGEWWREFALPRAAWSLLIGVPLGAVVAVLMRQPPRRRNSSSGDGERTDRRWWDSV